MNVDSKKKENFGYIRSLFWPIQKSETKRFLPLIILYSLICFNYSLLRPIKDALIVTNSASGAAVIPFIKIWTILPLALLTTFLITWLFSRYKLEKIFYIVMISFLSFFLIFTFVLYPLKDSIHPHGLCSKLEALSPVGLFGFIEMIRNWSFTLFYGFSEIWGTAIMSVLFWSFVNGIMSISDAKRFYTLLAVGANISAMLAGQMAIFLTKDFFGLTLNYGIDPWVRTLTLVNILVVIIGILSLCLFRWYNKKVLKKHHPTIEGVTSNPPKTKTKMSFKESFLQLKNSKYLMYISIIVIGYNLSINIVEIIWKEQIRIAHPNPMDFTAYMGKILIWIGFLSLNIALFIGGNFIRAFGWTKSALITPIAFLTTGILFFIVLLFQENAMVIKITELFGITPLIACIFFGSLQNIFSRACKYTLFDATKEMAFIPLNWNDKFKGKAAIDGVGSRFGKTGGSIIYNGLIMCFGSMAACTPVAGMILLGVVACWIFATKSLGRKFDQLSGNQSVKNDEQTDPSHRTAKVPI